MTRLSALEACVHKDLRCRWRDRWSLLTWLAVPLVIGGLITSLTGGTAGPRVKVRMLVTDLDGSFVSSLVSGAFTQGPMKELVSVETVALEDGRRRIEAGEASGLLVIPAGFGDAALQEEPTRLELWTNPEERIRPQILEQGLSLLVDGGFYLHRILGPEIQAIAKAVDGETDLGETEVANLSVAMQRKIQRLGPYLLPPILDVEPKQKSADTAPSASFAMLIFPGILLMSLLMTAQGLAEDLWRERELGTLRRLLSAPHSLAGFLPGKVIAAAAVFLAISALILSLGFVFHGLPLVRLPAATLWLVLSGVVLYLLLSLVQVLVPTRRAGALTGQMLIFPLMMVGGSFFPSEAMPGILAAIGGFTPNGFMVERLKAYLVSGEVDVFGGPTLILLLASAVLFVLVDGITRRTFAGGEP